MANVVYLRIDFNKIKKQENRDFAKEYLKVKPYKIRNSLFYSVDKSSFEKIKNIMPRDFKCIDANVFERIKDQFFEKKKKVGLPSFDVIGNIAILSKEYGREEAKKIMQVNKNINAVYRETGKHETEFRIQPLEFLTGDEFSETIHKENNTLLKLDVKKVYFSPRLGTERLRIIKQVKPKERVMILFSGVGPYVYGIAKNTKANYVYGIELNLHAHKYAYENKFLNKTHNVLPLYGDVRQIMPKLPQYIFGLKSSIDEAQLHSRNRETRVYEIHALVDDLFDDKKFENVDKKKHNLNRLISVIRNLNGRGYNVFVHIPLWLNGKRIKDPDFILLMLRLLGKVAKQEHFFVVVHLPEISDKELETLLMKIEKYRDFFYFENLFNSLRFFEDFLKIKDKIKNVALDVSHLAMSLFKKFEFQRLSDESEVREKLTGKVIGEIKKFDELFNLYFHLSEFDLKGQHPFYGCDGSIIENKYLDFDQILRFASFGIVEVKNEDENKPVEMLKSHEFVSSLKFHHDWFDRIAMPLPLGADSFLGYAIPYVKNHGIIHLYDFVDESEFPNRTITKFKRFAEKYNINFKVLNAIKTAEISPRKYRVCLDIEIIKSK